MTSGPSQVHAPCWWCGAAADSREHKFKRSDLIRVFGSPPYQGERTLVRHSDGRRTEASGPASDVFKFDQTVCRKCNNERSQPFDRAYERFIGFVSDEADSILQTMRIPLSSVFGSSWEIERDNLTRYYVKHICCRIADLRTQYLIEPDASLVAYLNGGPPPAKLELDLYVDSMLLSMWKLLRSFDDVEDLPTEWFVSLGPVHGELLPVSNQLVNPQSTTRYGWLSLTWRYGVSDHFVSPFARETVSLRKHSSFPRRGQLRFAVARSRARLQRSMRSARRHAVERWGRTNYFGSGSRL